MTPDIRPKEDQNLWNFLFSIVFAVLLYISAREIYLTHGTMPTSIPLFDALILALATFRVVRLVAYDKITRFVREFFMNKRVMSTGNGPAFVEITPLPRGLRRTISDLLQCPWCLGVWVSLAIVFAYFEFTWAWYVILMLAVAGVGSLFQITANLIGWNAELGKIETLSKEKANEGRC